MTAVPMEQPDDWTEPGAYPVAPGVHRIPLPLPHLSLHAVNAYVIEDAAGPVVIDSGWAMPDTEKALSAALRRLGHKLEDVSQVLVTHAHWDHFSQALVLRRTLGTRVRIGRGERPSIDAHDPAAGHHPRQIALLRRHGAAEIAARLAATDARGGERDAPPLGPDAWIDDGERIALNGAGGRAGGALEALATPGHTRGHIVLRDAAAGALFAGDHVLPHITPSIGLETEPEPLPLRSYLDSLRLVAGLPDALLLPAHGPVTPSVHRRVDELIAHHEERLAAAGDRVRAGARTAYEVARALPWTRRRRTLDDLDVFSQMLAVLEIAAHLDVLAEAGVLDSGEAGEAGEIVTYAPRS